MDDDGAEQIAAERGVDVDVLRQATWELQEREGNNGEVYGYFVRFADDNDPAVLAQLGLAPNEFLREVSINAFDEPDDGLYSIDEPLPDISQFIEDDSEVLARPERRSSRGDAYYLDDERFTPSQFRRLSRRRKVRAIVQWFRENYEDPAVRTPYESAEGGYQWIWGGPYDAREEISDQFSDVADEVAIGEAVDEVESDGLLDWAPKESPDDYDQGEDIEVAQPDGSLAAFAPLAPRSTVSRRRARARGLGSSSSNALTDGNGNRLVLGEQEGGAESLRSEMLERLDHLEALLRKQFVAPNRGHNHPPELLEIETPVTQAQIQELAGAIAEIRAEAVATSPNPAVVVTQASILRRFGKWLADATGNAAVGAVVGGVLTLAYTNRQALFDAAMSAADAAMAWAHQLPALY